MEKLLSLLFSKLALAGAGFTHQIERAGSALRPTAEKDYVHSSDDASSWANCPPPIAWRPTGLRLPKALLA